MISSSKFILALFVAAASFTRAARAADVTVLATEQATDPNLIHVVAPQARCAAVSDVASALVFAHRPLPDKPGSLSVFGIDAQGNAVGVPGVAPPPPADAAAAAAAAAAPPPPTPLFTVELPRPASLAAFSHGAQYLLFHPKLPLLYVWQDIAGPPMTSAKDNPVFREFDHLLVYSLAAGQPPKLELATARGQGFMYGVDGAMLSLDASGKRMSLPNVRSLASADNVSTSAYGCVALDDRGLPVSEAGQLKMTAHDLPGYYEFPAGMGCVFASDTVAVVGGSYGPVTWDTGNRRARFGCYLIAGPSPGRQRLAGHPTLPRVYTSCLSTPWAFAMEHADGYLTMQHQQLTLTHATIVTPPVMMGTKNKIAFGGSTRVYVVSLDEAGRFATDGATATVVNNVAAEALTYSEKHDRLYVAVEKTP